MPGWNGESRLRFEPTGLERDGQDHHLALPALALGLLAEQQERVGRLVPGHPLHLAHAAETSDPSRRGFGLAVGALRRFHDLAPTGDQEDPVTNHRDVLEVSRHWTSRSPDAEALHGSPGEVDLIHHRVLVAMGQQASIGRVGETGYLGQLGRKLEPL